MSLTFLPQGVTSVAAAAQDLFGSKTGNPLPTFDTSALAGMAGAVNPMAPINQVFSSGIASGAMPGMPSLPGMPTTPSASQLLSGGGSTSPAATDDLRVRLSALPAQEDQVYGEKKDDGSNILSILHDTRGVVFPYTPSISVEQSVEYKSIDLTHANWDMNSYTRTPSVTINVSGKFSVQNQFEGQYVVAVVHFLRTVSKMYFGEQAKDLAGLPPPILYFNGYGNYMFNGLKCVLKSHSFSLEDSVDYVNVRIGDTVTRVPSLLTITMSLGIQQTPSNMRKAFNLEEFRTGEMMRGNNKGWI